MLKVAQIQFAPKLGDCQYNNDRILGYFDELDDVDLIVLPELINSGYKFHDRDHAMSVTKQKACADYVDILKEYSLKNNVYIVSGYLELKGEDLYNSAIYISPNGTVGNYRKMHLFLDEKKIFKSGDVGLPVFNIGKYKMGMLICFDYLFPEIWRIMALKGVDFVVHPSNLITTNAYIVVPAQSLMNGYYIITSNRTGAEDDITFCGKSFITNPRGVVISHMGETEEGIQITDIDPLLSRNKMITPGNNMLEDRQPQNYTEILK